MFNIITINDHDFKLLSDLIYSYSGITLTLQKKPLLIGRLQSSVKRLGFNNFKDYYSYILSDTSGTEISDLINCISTNHTYFYREEKHFEYLANIVLPEITRKLRNEGLNDLRIWCAGCSSGEEAYMIAMILHEFYSKEYYAWNAGVLATDISEKVLDQARSGIYSQDNLKKLPIIFLKYFNKKGDQYVASEKLKKEVTFRRFNLTNDYFPFKKAFDIIFCRNVMIYFDKTTRDQLINKFYDYLNPGGYLFISHTESIGRDQHMFKYIQPAIYRRI